MKWKYLEMKEVNEINPSFDLVNNKSYFLRNNNIDVTIKVQNDDIIYDNIGNLIKKNNYVISAKQISLSALVIHNNNVIICQKKNSFSIHTLYNKIMNYYLLYNLTKNNENINFEEYEKLFNNLLNEEQRCINKIIEYNKYLHFYLFQIELNNIDNKKSIVELIKKYSSRNEKIFQNNVLEFIRNKLFILAYFKFHNNITMKINQNNYNNVLPGGHFSKNDSDIKNCLLREIKEETYINLKNEHFKILDDYYIVSIYDKIINKNYITYVFSIIIGPDIKIKEITNFENKSVIKKTNNEIKNSEWLKYNCISEIFKFIFLNNH